MLGEGRREKGEERRRNRYWKWVLKEGEGKGQKVMYSENSSQGKAFLETRNASVWQLSFLCSEKNVIGRHRRCDYSSRISRNGAKWV